MLSHPFLNRFRERKSGIETTCDVQPPSKARIKRRHTSSSALVITAPGRERRDWLTSGSSPPSAAHDKFRPSSLSSESIVPVYFSSRRLRTAEGRNAEFAVKHRACVDYSRSRSSQMDVACSFSSPKELSRASRFHYSATRPGKHILPSAPAMALTGGRHPAVCVRVVFVLFCFSASINGASGMYLGF